MAFPQALQNRTFHLHYEKSLRYITCTGCNCCDLQARTQRDKYSHRIWTCRFKNTRVLRPVLQKSQKATVHRILNPTILCLFRSNSCNWTNRTEPNLQRGNRSHLCHVSDVRLPDPLFPVQGLFNFDLYYVNVFHRP